LAWFLIITDVITEVSEVLKEMPQGGQLPKITLPPHTVEKVDNDTTESKKHFLL